MIVSETHKFVYMPPQKTGSTAVAQALQRDYGARVFNWEDMGIPKMPQVRFGTDGKHVMRLPERYADYFVFATVRNPYTRTVSQYRHLRDRTGLCLTFREYLERFLPLRSESLYYDLKQYPEYVPPPGCVKFNLHAVLRQETLEEDYARLPFVGRRVTLDRTNATPDTPCPKYTWRTAAMVWYHRAEDFKFFGYGEDLPEGLM